MFSVNTSDLKSMLIILIILSTIILFSKKIFKNTSPEESRKIIHVFTGVTVLTFPYIFKSFLPVLIIGILSIGMLSALRYIKFLNEKLGHGLFDVDRKSYGELFFGISVVLLFFLYKITNQNVIVYIIPILTLTFADSTAALIGVRYGQNKISSQGEDTKSIEGSFIFFIVTFMCTLFPLQLMTQTGRTEVLLISIFTGVLAAMVEMVSSNGNDNILLPIYTYIVINYNINQPLEKLLYCFVIMLGLICLSYAIYKWSKISKLAVISALISGYLTLILGSINWLYIPILVFLSFGVFPLINEKESQNELNYKVIEANTIIGNLFVCLRSIIGMRFNDLCFLCFLTSYACHLGINTYVRLNIFHNYKPKKAVILSIIKTLLIIEIPYILFNAYHDIYRIQDWFILLFAYILAIMIQTILVKKTDYSKTNIIAAKLNVMSILMITLTIFIPYITFIV